MTDNPFHSLDSQALLVLDFLKDKGFSPILVGGSVRDWVLTGNLGKDLDFELVYQKTDGQFIPTFFDKIFKEIKRLNSFQVECLSLNVYRLIFENGLEMEFSPPRIERYEGLGPYGHSDFHCEFYAHLPFRDSFRRRDFTINAIGLRYRSDRLEWIDPFKGLEDLKQKKLKPCDPHSFSKDPVRLLRLCRFAERFDLIIDPLDFPLTDHCLKLLSFHHLMHEGKKAGTYRFLNRLMGLLTEGQKKNSFLDLTQFSWPSDDQSWPLKKEDFILDLLCANHLNLPQIESWEVYIGGKKGLITQYKDFFDLLKKLSKRPPVKELISSWKDFSDSSWAILLNSCFIHSLYPNIQVLERIKRYNPSLSETWIELKEIFQGRFSGMKAFQEMIESDLPPEQRRLAKLYCHLKEVL